MSSYNLPNGENDPIQIVRTIGRLSQMLLEIRDEYIRDPREDTLDQFERRLSEISQLGTQLRSLRASLDESTSVEDPFG
jgi:hypothetical protein